MFWKDVKIEHKKISKIKKVHGRFNIYKELGKAFFFSQQCLRFFEGSFRII